MAASTAPESVWDYPRPPRVERSPKLVQVVLSGGVSGTHAATIAVGMGASVTVIDRSHEALKRLSAEFGSSLRTVYSTRASIADLVREADLVIGAVLLPGGARHPRGRDEARCLGLHAHGGGSAQ